MGMHNLTSPLRQGLSGHPAEGFENWAQHVDIHFNVYSSNGRGGLDAAL